MLHSSPSFKKENGCFLCTIPPLWIPHTFTQVQDKTRAKDRTMDIQNTNGSKSYIMKWPFYVQTFSPQMPQPITALPGAQCSKYCYILLRKTI